MKVDIDTSDKLYADAWLGFKGTDWKNEINVRDFIQHNYTPYEGDESFLAEATPATTELWETSLHSQNFWRCEKVLSPPRASLADAFWPIFYSSSSPCKNN